MSTMLKPMDTPPSWYCDYKLPTNLLGTFTPLVYLTGLDLQNNQTHRGFWELLNIKNPNKDFQPTYMNVSIDHKFREKKVKQLEMVEYYIPRGIIKTNWVNKHSEEIPSAVVAFFDMNWSDPQWNQRKLELAKRIKDLKANLAPHGTQVLVMLIKPSGIAEDNFSTDRASAFCAAAEIPPKYLFVLAHSNAERIQACIQRLEMGMRELAKAYYSNRIKKVKAWKDKITVTPMLVRYNFKIAFFQEIRRDHIAALNHYQTANEALLSIKATDANIQELKVVAGVLSYRMSRIYLTKMDGKDSKNIFDKHIRSFQKMIGNQELLFEHFAWLSQQYYQYGDLLKQFYRGVISGIPDPVPYFITAGKYVEKRRKAFQERVGTQGKVLWPAEMNPYNGEAKLLCLGQRPWWNNPFSQDYLYAVEDENSIKALKYFESLCKHTESIISDWGIASDFCRDAQRMRTRCQLMSMMGGEFYQAKDYAKCIMLMTHIMREFGHEDWNIIVYDVISIGFKAACCEGDIPAYCNFLMILLKLDIIDLVTVERQNLLWTKFQTLMNGQIPLPEENCEMNREKWEKGLLEPSWTSYVEVHSQPVLSCKVFFLTENAHLADEPIIRFIIKNNSRFSIPIRKYGIRTNVIEYNCESDIDATLEVNETRELDLSFKPLLRDLSKNVLIQIAYVDIGRENRSVLLHFSFLKPSSPYLWVAESKEPQVAHPVLRIEQSKPLLQIKTTKLDSILVDEWQKIVVSLINTDVFDYGKINFACQVQTTDPQQAVLTLNKNVKKMPGLLTQTFDIPRLANSSTHEAVLYLKILNHTEAEFKFVVKASYLDTHSQPMALEHVELMKILSPFDVDEMILDLQKNDISGINVDETFIAQFNIENTSNTALRIIDCSLNITSPCFELRQQNEKQCNDIVLKNLEEVTCVFLLSATAIETASLGALEINWKRDEDDDDAPVSRTLVPVTPIPSKDDNSLYLQGTFSNDGHGKLKEPMRAYYTLTNRTTRVYDLSIFIESSESFMNAGPKKISLKLHGMDSYKFGYILFPLVTGLVDAPNLSIVTPANGTTILDPIPLAIRQNSAKTLYITA